MYIVRFLLYSNTMKKILGFDIHKLQLILYNDRSPNEEPNIRRVVETYARRRDPRQDPIRPRPSGECLLAWGAKVATPLCVCPGNLGRGRSGGTNVIVDGCGFDYAVVDMRGSRVVL